MVDELQSLLEKVETGAEGSLEAFHDAALRYSKFMWRHFGVEEDVIIPAAVHHLLAEDWDDIKMAFSDNNDPRFGGEADADLRKLFSRIVNLVNCEPSKASAELDSNVTT